MENYKPNSYKYKAEQEESAIEKKKVEKVVSGTVKNKKKNEIQKFANVFVSEDIQNVKTYIVMDILIPSLKRALSDIVKNGIDMILYGESGGRSNSKASKVSYRSYYDKVNDRDYSNNRIRTGYSYDDIVIESRGEAEEVLDRMNELLSVYKIVSVADLYDLVGITGNYTDNKYGWTDLNSARVVSVRDGYLLKLPKALPLD